MLFPTLLIGLHACLAQNDDFEAFFQEFAKKRDGIRVLEAPFVQTTISPDETVTSKGSIVYSRPKRLIFRYDDPEQAYVLDGLRAYEYDPEVRQVQIFDIEDRPSTEAFFLGFDNDTSRLREAYTVTILPPETNGDEGKSIRLTPKDPESEEAYFESVTIKLRAKDFLPTEVYIINSSESEVLIRVSDYTINGELSPEKTQLQLPEGTDIIDNETFVETVGKEGKRVPPAAVAQDTEKP